MEYQSEQDPGRRAVGYIGAFPQRREETVRIASWAATSLIATGVAVGSASTTLAESCPSRVGFGRYRVEHDPSRLERHRVRLPATPADRQPRTAEPSIGSRHRCAARRACGCPRFAIGSAAGPGRRFWRWAARASRSRGRFRTRRHPEGVTSAMVVIGADQRIDAASASGRIVIRQADPGVVPYSVFLPEYSEPGSGTPTMPSTPPPPSAATSSHTTRGSRTCATREAANAAGQSSSGRFPWNRSRNREPYRDPLGSSGAVRGRGRASG